MKRIALIVTCLAAVAATYVAPRAQDTRGDDVALKAAQHKEEVEGDLAGALDAYRRLAAGANRAVAAQALLRIGGIQQKQGSAEAWRTYERVVREFADQEQAARAARDRIVVAQPGARMTHRAVWQVTEGGDIYGKASRDGRYLPYTDWGANGNGNLFLHDNLTGANRQLTFGKNVGEEWAEQAVFSRDGRFVAFAWSVNDKYQVRLLPLDGVSVSPTPRVLLDNPEIQWLWPEDWTPDGKWIALGIQRRDGTSQVALLSVENGELKVLTSLPWRGYMGMSISPDGRYLAYDYKREQTNASDIHVLTLDGGRMVRAVSHGSADDRLAGWSPDSTRIVYTSNRAGQLGLWSVTFADGEVRGVPGLLKSDMAGHTAPLGVTSAGSLLTTSGTGMQTEIMTAEFDFDAGRFVTEPQNVNHNLGHSPGVPMWSPDGKSLAYVLQQVGRGEDPVVIIRAENGAMSALRPGLSFLSLVWRRTGEALNAVGTDFDSRQGIYRIDRETGAAQLLVRAQPGERIFLPVFSDDFQTMYYRRQVMAASESTLMQRNVATGDEVEVGRGAEVGLSVDRKAVVMLRRIAGTVESEIVERNLATGVERQLLRHPHLRTILPTARANGVVPHSILAVSHDPTTDAAVWLQVSLAGGPPRELIRAVAPRRLSLFTIAPDGNSVYARVDSGPGARPRDSELWRVSLTGEGVRRVELNVHEVSLDAIGIGRGVAFSVNPDGRRVAFAVRPAEVPFEVWALDNFLPASSRQ